MNQDEILISLALLGIISYDFAVLIIGASLLLYDIIYGGYVK